MTNARSTAAASPSRRWSLEIACVIVLTTVIQFLLYGTSFSGHGVLLPIQLLRQQGVYSLQGHHGEPLPNSSRLDLVQVAEPNRWFMASEYRAGRIPLWTPYRFAGSPLARAPIFSPFELLYVIWPSPRVLPWMQLMSALVAATGAWLLAVRVLVLGPHAAITVGCAYPLTGFLVLWQGFDLTYPVALFPWQLLAALALVSHVSSLNIVGLALATAITVVSGQTDTAGQVLLATGMIWVWHAVGRWIVTRQFAPFRSSIFATTIGWTLGFLLAAPVILPLAESLRSSARATMRSQGHEAREPVGLMAAPLFVFPEAFGSERDNTVFASRTQSSRLESAAGGYSGCVALLFVLPWAWLDRSRRSWVWCLTAMAIVASSWQLNIPGLIDFWRLPGFRMLSTNRFVFVTALSTLLLAGIGLEQIVAVCSMPFPRSLQWAWIATLVCVAGCVAGLMWWPAELRQIPEKSLRGLSRLPFEARFLQQYWFQLGWFLACLLCWIIAIRGLSARVRLPWIVSALMIGDLVWRAWGLHPQPDPAMYFPRIPALEFVQRSAPGRCLGIACLSPNLLESHKLRDIRGYDGADPQAAIDVLMISAHQRMKTIEYAQTLFYVPMIVNTDTPNAALQVHPTLEMLGLKYLIVNGSAPKSVFADDEYSIVEIERAMPRAWVPKRVLKRDSEIAVMKSMLPWEFFPSEQAFVTEAPGDLPDQCSGKVEIVGETPQSMSLKAEMQTPGLVIVSEGYHPGWQATVNGKPAPVLCTNHMLRGVVAPAGSHAIEFQYRPQSFARAVWLCVTTSVIVLTMGLWPALRSGLVHLHKQTQVAGPS